jgi:hypothetical protein
VDATRSACMPALRRSSAGSSCSSYMSSARGRVDLIFSTIASGCSRPSMPIARATAPSSKAPTSVVPSPKRGRLQIHVLGDVTHFHVDAYAPDATLWVYDGVFHAVEHEPEPERIIEDAIRWLDTRTTVRKDGPAEGAVAATGRDARPDRARLRGKHPWLELLEGLLHRHAQDLALPHPLVSAVQKQRPTLGIVLDERLQTPEIRRSHLGGVLDLDGVEGVATVDDEVDLHPPPGPPGVQVRVTP